MDKKKSKRINKCAICNKPVNKINGFVHFSNGERVYLHYGICERKYNNNKGKFVNRIKFIDKITIKGVNK